MTPDEKAVAAHFHFDALKSALRQTKEGVAALGIQSRSLIAKEPMIYREWQRLETMFLADTGQMAESR